MRPNYSRDKRKKELDRQKKREEKAQKKKERKEQKEQQVLGVGEVPATENSVQPSDQPGGAGQGGTEPNGQADDASPV